MAAFLVTESEFGTGEDWKGDAIRGEVGECVLRARPVEPVANALDGESYPFALRS
jgi:hypothetical protein